MKALRARVETYHEKVNEVVECEIKVICSRLVDDLTPGLLQKPPKAWLDHTLDGVLDEKRIKELLSEKIKFALSHVQKDFKPVVTLIFKDVTYGTIVHDPEFRKKLEAYFGHQEVKRLFNEWEAARASSPQLDGGKALFG